MASARKAALQKLNAVRAGEKRSKQYTKELASKDHRIYDEVEESVYKQVVKNRLLQDDFVEDDGATGYADNGEEDWDAPGDDQQNDSEEERRARKAKKVSSNLATTKAKAKAKPKPPPQPVTIDAYRRPVAAEQEDDFMNNLLSGLDAAPLPSKLGSSTASRKRKPSVHSESEDIMEIGDGFMDRHRPPPPSSDPVDYSSPLKPSKKAKLGDHSSDAESFSDGIEMNAEDEYDKAFDDFDFNNLQFEEEDVKPVIRDEDVKPALSPQKPAVDKKKPKVVHSSEDTKDIKPLDLETPAWQAINDKLTANAASSVDYDTLGPLTGSTAAASTAPVSALEEDGTLRFYWLDYLELDGKLYFTGKVLDKGAAKGARSWVSCCVAIDGIQRNLFVRPREFKLDEDGDPTTDEPTEDDLYDEFDQIRKKLKIKSWEGKFVKRKYVFDDCEPGSDPEQQYLKVIYGFNEPRLPDDITSPSIERIFGTNTSAFELFVLKRRIMGPCWLEIKEPVISAKGISWCRLEVEVSDPKNVHPFDEKDHTAPRGIPPLTIASISLRTIVNHVANAREIVASSIRFWDDMDPDDAQPPEELPSTVHTAVRCLDRFPAGFEQKANAERSPVHPMRSEKALLSSLLAIVKKRDPDVIVGHEFLGEYLDILLMRIKFHKVEPWSSIGRFRRTKWPIIGRQGTNIRFLQGRLLCDLSSDAAKSMISSTTWSLTEMCTTHLSFNRHEIDPEDTAMYFDSTVSSPDRLMSFVRLCEMDTFLQMALCTKVQMLPLTKQLTNLAGNSWNKTLNGGRAERNEYILLHEFHRLKYISPDKTYGKKVATATAKAEAETAEDGTTVPVPTKGKKDKYKGGLVFEPKRGLWDKYILVMDFNSLYPSIIQEYNIDFTTVIKEEIFENGEEKIPDPPAEDVQIGVLPRLIATLVERRKNVKGLMKDPKATDSQRMQWDIKQKALKLTANSMYGCLGFEYSRFYARPLAALTTSKGREILTRTKELAEELNLDVVYGDTDSVFVNSNAENFKDALKVANLFKKHVNERYRLLEIDLDATFQRLLLLQKKKYAALKVESADKTSVEIKGLDMKRREFCNLSKNVSKRVLDLVLSGQSTDIVIEEIHEYLRSVGETVRAGNVSLDDLTIFKRLGKAPEDYDPKGQPHVQVALRMKARGGSAKAGDVIPYIFCLGADGQSSRTAQAENAKHPDEVRRGGDDVRIDYEFYLSQQILPPVERLCDPIEGTDRARIAECLGMDPSRFQAVSAVSFDNEVRFDTLLSDKDRFHDAEPFSITCQSCEGSFEFPSLETTTLLSAQGVACPSCNTVLGAARLQLQLQHCIRAFVSRYYEGWVQCSEETCQATHRAIGVQGRRCVQPTCQGLMHLKYSGTQLYNQLLYLQSIFDTSKPISDPALQAKFIQHGPFLRTLSDVVQGYLAQSGQRWVDLDTLFLFST